MTFFAYAERCSLSPLMRICEFFVQWTLPTSGALDPCIAILSCLPCRTMPHPTPLHQSTLLYSIPFQPTSPFLVLSAPSRPASPLLFSSINEVGFPCVK
ncbi:hypothetical protein V1478_008621 [Vespula squamosa]|uniref:Uncharacterized protein n=1 Tax=Vespula squamosa TaxID=30214 RepID=A0ABD2AU44_VESSQ